MRWPGSASYHQYLNHFLLERLPHDRNLYVLDNMTGTGVFLPALHQRFDHVFGVDLSEKAVAYAGAYSPNVVTGDATSLPFADHSFDIVFIRGGIHHVPNMQGVFSEVARVLKPQGRCIMLEPLEDNPLIHFIRRMIYHLHSAFDANEERGLTSKQFETLLRDSHMQMVHRENYGLLGFALFCNPDTIPFTRPFSFLPGAAVLSRKLAALDRVLVRFRLLRAFAFETFIIAQKI